MRVVAGPHTRRRHKKVLKLAKGFTSRRKSCIRFATEQVMRKLKHVYKHRKNHKGDMRGLWIIRINAAVRQIDADYSYSRFMNGLKKASINLNRKALADLAATNVQEFAKLVEIAKQHP
ncbi:MAG: 50S ribosomal protein L20 [Candidatus Riflebacteria bacterium]|nr:50S ribosomal protein L20 [Candidatus Riflebacteria bacterium]